MNKKEKPLAKVVPNKGRRANKNRDLEKGTKKGIANRPNQHIDIDLFNSWVDNLDSSTQESFCSFAADNYSVIEVYLYARFLGYEGTITACDLWVKDNYVKPDHRKKLLYEIDEMQEDIRKLREDRSNIIGEDQSRELEKRIFLQSIDINWKSHIQYLEQLRQVIGLRSYGQRDPLIEYKKEAFDLFENLLNKLKSDFITILMNLRVVESSNERQTNSDSLKKSNLKIPAKKIGRNEPCFCGSGKKYKHCCGSL